MFEFNSVEIEWNIPNVLFSEPVVPRISKSCVGTADGAVVIEFTAIKSGGSDARNSICSVVISRIAEV